MYSFVTIGFDADLPWLRLQARSLARYLSPDLVSEILVVDNGFGPGWRKEDLRKEYGKLAAQVRFVDSRPLPKSMDGWRRQQVLKLRAASWVKSPAYMTLDCKNVLVFPLRPEFLASGGRFRTRLINFHHISQEDGVREMFLKCLHGGENYFDVKVDATRFPPFITPLVMVTSEVKSMMQDMQADGDFASVFSGTHSTEFILYWCWLSRRGRLWELYDFSAPACAAIWTSTPASEIEPLMTRPSEKQPFFSVHRRAWAILDSRVRSSIKDFWRQRGLDGSFIQ